MQFQKRKTLSYSVQWYAWIYRNMHFFFRKSILVGHNTLIWLRIRPPVTPVKKITNVVDQLTKFETPIKTRFLSLVFSKPVMEKTEAVPESSYTKNTRDLPVQMIYNDFWHFCTVLVLQSLVGYPHPDKGPVPDKEVDDVHMDTNTVIPANTSSLMWSSGIEPCFYDMDEYTDEISVVNNDLEKKWRSRILYIATPHGSIMMYYDAFKQGFAYYCDRMGLNYRLLNTVAMKYVMTFRCVDFFVDETVVHKNPSPFLVRFKQIEQVDQEKRQKNTHVLLGCGKTDIEMGKSPFVKSRPVAPVKGNIAVEELYRNKFIYMGKICNANLLQSIKKPPCVIRAPTETMMPMVSASSMFKTMYNDSATNVMNYKAFKESKSKL